jgi:hypothetical protein
MTKTHLCIAGHGTLANGNFDPGATGFITKGEHKYFKEDFFPAMKKFLPKGHNVVFYDKRSVVSHGDLVKIVQEYNADEVTEFHFDAFNATASGGHVIIHADYSPDALDLKYRDVIKEMIGSTRFTHRGHAGISGRSDLGNANRARNAKITYRLLELGFCTNEREAKILTGQVEEYAKKIVEVIVGETNNEKPATKPTDIANTNQQDSIAAKSVEQLAHEVIAGEHGNGEARKQALGSRYNEVQAKVNEILNATSATSPAKPAKKSVNEMAKEVIAGKHGNGHENRRKSLGISQAEYEQVRAEVNRLSGSGSSTAAPSKSIDQMAKEVIDGKHGNGHETRRKSLGISQSEYEKVRARVNELVGATQPTPKKSVDEVAREIINGQGGWGNNPQRAERLRAAGYDPAAVQRRVNQLI